MAQNFNWQKLLNVVLQALVAALTALGVSSCYNW